MKKINAYTTQRPARNQPTFTNEIDVVVPSMSQIMDFAERTFAPSATTAAIFSVNFNQTGQTRAHTHRLTHTPESTQKFTVPDYFPQLPQAC